MTPVALTNLFNLCFMFVSFLLKSFFLKVNDEKCNGRKPWMQESCNRIDCPTWIASSWSGVCIFIWSLNKHVYI